MCVHHWMLDSCDRGICKLCGQKRDFSPPPIRLTEQEKNRIMINTQEYYMQGILRISEMNRLIGLSKIKW